jgi:glucokinase
MPRLPNVVWRARPVCEETLLAFCEMLGTVAGNVALTLGAKGGIYIGGRVVPPMLAFFERSASAPASNRRALLRLSGAHPHAGDHGKISTLIGMSAMLSAA